MKNNRNHIFKILLVFAYLFLALPFIISQNANFQDNYDAKHYFIDVAVSDTSTYISATAKITFEVLVDNDTVILDFGNQLLISNLLLDAEVPDKYYHSNNKLVIIDQGFKPGMLYQISVSYEGDGNSSEEYGAVFNKEFPPFGSFTYTLTEPYSTKHWYPCKEILKDKVDSVFVFITVDSNFKAGSNGLLEEVRDLGNGKYQYRWKSYYPTAFYLVSFAIGNYHDYTFYSGGENSFPIVNYLYNSSEYIEAEKQNIDTTRQLLNIFSELFGPYPFSNEKYGHCVVPQGGGMEHQTMSTMGNFGYNLVAHELAHQWFGNYVTCSAWNHIWINEGFASYSEYLAHEFSEDPEGANSWIEYAQQAAINNAEGSVYVPDDELESASRIFHYSTTYKKGAAIIHMLRYEIADDEAFFRILKEFLNRYRFDVASADDLQEVVEEETNRSFSYFFNQWYYGQGYPEFSIDWYQQNDTVVIVSKQTGSLPQHTSFFEMNTSFKLNYPNGDTTLHLRQYAPETIHKISFTDPVVDIRFDPTNILLKQVNSLTRIDSLSSLKLPELFIYPNPAGDCIRVYSNTITTPINLRFYTMAGSVIKTVSNISPFGTDVSVSDLVAGMYLVSVEMGQRNSVLKLIKS